MPIWSSYEWAEGRFDNLMVKNLIKSCGAWMESQSALAMVSANAQDREPPNCCISTYTYIHTCTNPLLLILVFVHIHLCVCVGSERMDWSCWFQCWSLLMVREWLRHLKITALSYSCTTCILVPIYLYTIYTIYTIYYMVREWLRHLKITALSYSWTTCARK